MIDTRAGLGEHRSYVLKQDAKSDLPQLSGHYIAIDAVSWFVNQDSSWFRERMATGTLSIVLEAGPETFEVALGLYELDGGARIAPVSDRAIISERVYQGGRITFKAHLSGVARDTSIGKLLRGASSASLAVAETIVQVSSPIPGASQALNAASSLLVGGVRDLLSEQGEQYRLFDPATGIEKTLQPSDFSGESTYLLLHRGRNLVPASLSIGASENSLTTVLYEGSPLTDGVWLLLRIRCVSEYPVTRPWLSDYDQWWQRVYVTIDELSVGMLTQEDAASKFDAGTEIAPSLHDEYCRVREMIIADSVLTRNERVAYAGMLRNLRRIASSVINNGNYSDFFDQTKNLNLVAQGSKMTNDIEIDFLRELKSLDRNSKASYQSSNQVTSFFQSSDFSTDEIQLALPKLIRLQKIIQKSTRL